MYKNIREFIDELKRNNRVIALIKYGKREVDDMSVGEDFDLFIIMNDFASNIESVHFYIGNVPVEVNLRGYSDLLLDKPVSKFDLELLNGEILFDKSGIIQRMLQKSKENWVEEKEKRRLKKHNEIEWIRFSYKHILDKLRYMLNDNELYSRFTIDVTMKNLIDTYIDLENIECDEGNILEKIKLHENIIYQYLNDFYLENSLDKKFNILCKIAGVIFKKSNGICKEEEVMFLARDNDEEITELEKDEIIEILALYN